MHAIVFDAIGQMPTGVTRAPGQGFQSRCEGEAEGREGVVSIPCHGFGVEAERTGDPVPDRSAERPGDTGDDAAVVAGDGLSHRGRSEQHGQRQARARAPSAGPALQEGAKPAAASRAGVPGSSTVATSTAVQRVQTCPSPMLSWWAREQMPPKSAPSKFYFGALKASPTLTNSRKFLAPARSPLAASARVSSGAACAAGRRQAARAGSGNAGRPER